MGTHIGTRIWSWLKGEEVGRDQAGNIYYRQKGGGRVHPDSLRKERRWVIYKDLADASKVPADWHGWLHHTVEEMPDGKAKWPWQKEHRPNLTGTAQAYRPPGHVLVMDSRRDARAASAGSTSGS